MDFEVYGIGRKDFITDKFNYINCDINNSLETKNLFKEIKPQYLIHLAWDGDSMAYVGKEHTQKERIIAVNKLINFFMS